jgi:hypothetical protein
VNAENVVYLYDDKGEPQDKFRAKGNTDAAAGAEHPFTVPCMAYSPDSTRLALGQSDGIVYVYKLGLEWRGKKSISNKFPAQVRLSYVAPPPALLGFAFETEQTCLSKIPSGSCKSSSCCRQPLWELVGVRAMTARSSMH